MNALVLMMALLALVYLSSIIRRGRSGRVLGLAAGSEWLILGLVLGASGLGVVDRALQAEVEPVLYVAVGWVSLVIGVDYGVVRGRRLRLGRIVAGLTIGALTIAAVAGSAFWLTPLVGLELDGRG